MKIFILSFMSILLLLASCQKKTTNRSEAALVDFYGIPMSVDTLDLGVNLHDLDIFKVIKNQDSYYLLLYNQHHYLDSRPRESIIRISHDGTQVDTIPFDYEYDRASSYNWFVNHDTLFKSKGSEKNFYLDTDSLKWISTGEHQPIIYQDSLYEVTEDWGKGGVVYFKEKATNDYYEVGTNGKNQVYKVDTGYVITSVNMDLILNSQICLINNPENCDKLNSKPNYEEKLFYSKPTLGAACIYGCYEKLVQTEQLENEITPPPFLNEFGLSSFVYQNQTFHFVLEQGWHLNKEYFGKTESDSLLIIDSTSHVLRWHQNIYENDFLFSGSDFERLKRSPFLFETSNEGIHKTILRFKSSLKPTDSE